MQPVKKFPWMKQWLLVVKRVDENQFGQTSVYGVHVFPARVTYGDRLLASAFGVVGVFNMEAFTSVEAYELPFSTAYIQECSEWKPSVEFDIQDYNESQSQTEQAIAEYVGAIGNQVQPNRSSVRSDISQRRKYAYFSQTGG